MDAVGIILEDTREIEMVIAPGKDAAEAVGPVHGDTP